MRRIMLLCAVMLMTALMGCGSNKVEIQEPEVERLEEQTEDRNLTVSILGDSISTFDEWIPEGYQAFFPMNGEVTDVNQTWWKMVLDELEMELYVNGSSSGSTCVGDSASADNPKYGCSDYRIKALAGTDGASPDVIIVYMGTNDLVTSIPIGENDGTRAVEEGMIESFSDAYSLILDKLAANYPGAQIFCCTLAPVGDWGTEQPFVTFVNGQGLSAVEYSDSIKTIAGAKGYPVIDLQNCGITIDNMQQYVTDGVHLKPEGMVLIKDAIKKTLEEYY
ncbi:MAG: SGNH/GDSL hydrolase family protein [Lachnospiraceae bacterium]|nr:SGNH/GDSL hydrolase family protein [Lachnospiraceae bacterium]